MSAAPEPDDLSERLTRARSRATEFLLAGRKADGRWLDFRFRFALTGAEVISSHWVTAYVGASLAQCGVDPGLLAVSRDYLFSHQHPGGGWGFSKATPADADSTANVLHLSARLRGTEGADVAIRQAADLLLRYWSEEEGGFCTYRPVGRIEQGEVLAFPGSSWCDVHGCVTALAAEALYEAGAEAYSGVLEAAARRIVRSQEDAGYWEAYWWHGRTYSTYHAARLLSLLGEKEPVVRACEWIRGVRSPEGGWGNGLGGPPAPFHTALALGTLLLEPVPLLGVLREGIEWLLAAQEPDGGFRNTQVMRMPRPDIHAPWEDPEGCLLVPLLTDRNRLFTTATVLSTLWLYSVHERLLQPLPASRDLSRHYVS